MADESTTSTVTSVFRRCVEAVKEELLIQRESAKDKEFHFQNWFRQRLDETGHAFDEGGRNSYPDFRMVQFAEGYEVKGLAYPGRDANFDSNSQSPTGFHNERAIYYVFGRYPKNPDGNSYPLLDLVVCHGDFLNADHEYRHKNRNVKGFGTYGDIMIRDRKMYVVPTPFHLVDNVAHHHTLILPEEAIVGDEFADVGTLCRVESRELIVGYTFDLKRGELTPERAPNPGAGREHRFRAWRLKDAKGPAVSLRSIDPSAIHLEGSE